jgi:rhodanese-related sulfurtransferase
MKYAAYRFIVYILILSSIFSGCGIINNTVYPIFEDISVQDAAQLIKDNEGSAEFIILDVRTPEEFNSGHIEGAVNLNFHSNEFEDQLNKLDKDKIYLIYCRSGNRSLQAMQIMENLGFREVYNLSGGIIDWTAAGLPVVK